tara:strand:+ start:473 stop:1621 length:1149 start_codon:yes stop_codon:yes gene_type:complete
MRVCVRGPLLSISGYGNHTRQVYRWLTENTQHTLGTQILPWGITPWMINPDLENGLIGKIMHESIPVDETGFDVSFQVQLPNEWDSNLARFNVGVTAAVETDICNPHWIQCCNTMNLIVVPSNHTKETLQRSGALTTPIVVIPESFPDSILQENNLELDVRTSFNFLLFGQITGNNAYTDRKNTFFALKWITEEFNNDPDVGIVIKTNHGRNTSLDRRQCSNMLKSVVREMNTDVPVYLLHGALSDSEVAGLYKNEKIKALVAPTRGEGYGLPLLEAAASGLPVLATNWSGHKDFLGAGKWVSFDYDLADVPPSKIDDQIFLKSSRWAEVKEEDFKKKIRKFREKSQMPNEWALDLSNTLKQTHSFASIAKIWDETMAKYLR